MRGRERVPVREGAGEGLWWSVTVLVISVFSSSVWEDVVS